ncbi:hypothetical protein [Desulfosarcina cetonica]|uniref:hypothetical protein n=1 Tax=Desulfosarcina cetonica TaxID=90730 RepID=UPI0006CF7B35|nr:hypothetical protein [Desulfosarcina cetonica]
MPAAAFPSACKADVITHAAWMPHAWLAFNRQLNQDATALPNEAIIEKRLADLERLTVSDPRIYWLSLARIAELTLKQAADYADHCEFQAAGDLLVNPRRIDIYRHGQLAPVAKGRHQALSDQFASAIGNEDPVAWLSRETLPHIRRQALLPYFEGQLKDSGMLIAGYLASFSSRMRRVASTIAFLGSWQVATVLNSPSAWRPPVRRTGKPLRKHCVDSISMCSMRWAGMRRI